MYSCDVIITNFSIGKQKIFSALALLDTSSLFLQIIYTSVSQTLVTDIPLDVI